MVTILMIPAKIATPDPLKIKSFWEKVYDVIISGHDATTQFCHLIQIII